MISNFELINNGLIGQSNWKAPQWWEILVGVIFILLGICCFFFIKKTKASVEDYKKRQLEAFKNKNRKFHGNYEQSNLILPWSQRMKLASWPIIGLSLIIIGIFFSTGFMFTWFER